TAIWQHGRNIADDQIKGCAATGGVVGINGLGIFLGDNDVSNETFVNHACYVADLVGPEHVGIGL
ncbi:MAG: membrane dipeptidase, partial [Hyphomicrobiales bacterium]|nr:membrane dipeptidase [Hyphomicrobiales bacterium]